MGSCGSAIVDKAILQDGEQNLGQYIIARKKKQFATNYVQQIYKSTSSNIRKLKVKKLKEIDDKEVDARKHIHQLKQQVDKKEPGSVTKAEALHKKSAEQLLGLNQTVERLDLQRHNVQQKFQKEEKQILREIREDYQVIYDGINDSTAKLSHINMLSDTDRQKAFKHGEKLAEKNINYSNNELKEQMDKKFAFSRYEHRFDNVSTVQTLNGILDEHKQRAHRSSTLKGSKCQTC